MFPEGNWRPSLRHRSLNPASDSSDNREDRSFQADDVQQQQALVTFVIWRGDYSPVRWDIYDYTP
jgi:hypothetical protein